MRFPRRWLPLCTLLTTTVQTGCILLYSGEGGAGGNGGSNMTATSTGGLSAGGGGAGGASSSSGGGSGGTGGSGGNGGSGGGSCEDGAVYCGPGSSCDSEGLGFCTVVSAPTMQVANATQIAFVGGDSGQVVAYVADSGDDVLLVWPLLFGEDEGPSATATINDAGIGFIAAGGPNHIYYFGQLQNCDGDGATDSCVTVCNLIGTPACEPPVALTLGQHINGAVTVRGNVPANDTVYFAEASDASNELQRVSRACLESNPSCDVELATNYNAPNDNLDPLGMDSDPVDGSVWWNTWGGNNLTGACVYSYPAAGDVSQCLQTTPAIAYPNRLAVSANHVFVGTFDNSGDPGPIQRIGRCLIGNQYPVAALDSVTWPADADGHFLYATSRLSPNELKVLNANTGVLVRTLVANTDITSVDATNRDFLLFAAGNRIYRWRKPEPPCPSAPGPGMCGDGCVDIGEDCDDGNTDAMDGCGTSCGCELPQ